MKTYLHILQLHSNIKNISYPNILVNKSVRIPIGLWDQSTDDCNQNFWSCLFQKENDGELGYEMNSIHFQLYFFISSMAHFHKETIKRLVSRKYLLIEQSSNNIFLSNDVKDRVRVIFQKTQRTYLALVQFANIVRHKIGKAKIETDLRMESIDIRSKYSMCLYHSGSKYLFALSDLVNIIQTAITHSHNYVPNPLLPKNPFNNLPFTITNLYNIYFHIKSAFTTVPQWIHLYFLSEFNLDAFVTDNEQILREQYIKNYVTNGSTDVLYEDLAEMCSVYRRIFSSINIHEDFPRRDLIQIFRPYIYLYIISQNAIKGTEKRRLATLVVKKKLEEFFVYNPHFGRKSVSIKYIPKTNEEKVEDQREPVEDDSINVLDTPQDNLFRNHRRRYVSTFTFNTRHPTFTLHDACKSFDKKKILSPSSLRGVALHR